MSSDLVWELTRNQNAFIKKGLNGVVFSAEKGNTEHANTRLSSGFANYAAVQKKAKKAAKRAARK